MRKSYKLFGALRLPANGDTIGLALFQDNTTNYIYSVETDHYLRIKRFIKVTLDLDGIERLDHPDDYAPFQKNDYSPIPIWVNGYKYVFPGSIGREEVEIDLGPELSKRPAVQRLISMLGRARTKEVISAQESEDFFSSYRFVSHDFSGGRTWVSKLAAVLRQAHAYLRDDSPEWEMIERLVKRWIDVYVRKVSFDAFLAFVSIISRSDSGLANTRLITAVALLQRAIMPGADYRRFSTIEGLGLGRLADLREYVKSAASRDRFAHRHHVSLEAQLTSTVDYCFERGTVMDMITLVELCETFGALPISNTARVSFPRVVRNLFDQQIPRDEAREDRGYTSPDGLVGLAVDVAKVIGDPEASAWIISSYTKYKQSRPRRI